MNTESLISNKKINELFDSWISDLKKENGDLTGKYETTEEVRLEHDESLNSGLSGRWWEVVDHLQENNIDYICEIDQEFIKTSLDNLFTKSNTLWQAYKEDHQDIDETTFEENCKEQFIKRLNEEYEDLTRGYHAIEYVWGSNEDLRINIEFKAIADASPWSFKCPANENEMPLSSEEENETEAEESPRQVRLNPKILGIVNLMNINASEFIKYHKEKLKEEGFEWYVSEDGMFDPDMKEIVTQYVKQAGPILTDPSIKPSVSIESLYQWCLEMMDYNPYGDDFTDPMNGLGFTTTIKLSNREITQIMIDLSYAQNSKPSNPMLQKAYAEMELGVGAVLFAEDGMDGPKLKLEHPLRFDMNQAPSKDTEYSGEDVTISMVKVEKERAYHDLKNKFKDVQKRKDSQAPDSSNKQGGQKELTQELKNQQTKNLKTADLKKVIEKETEEIMSQAKKADLNLSNWESLPTDLQSLLLERGIKPRSFHSGDVKYGLSLDLYAATQKPKHAHKWKTMDDHTLIHAVMHSQSNDAPLRIGLANTLKWLEECEGAVSATAQDDEGNCFIHTLTKGISTYPIVASRDFPNPNLINKENLNIKNHEGKTPWDELVQNAPRLKKFMEFNPEFIERLDAAEVDWDTPCKDGSELLYQALGLEHHPTIEKFKLKKLINMQKVEIPGSSSKKSKATL